jgi:quercetin dioxygenase-like cupin family protein
MRSIFIIGFLFVFLFSGQALAEPTAKDLIDTKPGKASLIDVEKFFQDHPIEKGPARVEGVFKSPRAQVVFIRVKGSPIAKHYHTQADEVFYVYKGKGEIFLNGQWTPAKAGQFHTCPRGVVHTVRTGEDEEIWIISVFTVPLPPGGDRVKVD